MFRAQGAGGFDGAVLGSKSFVLRFFSNHGDRLLLIKEGERISLQTRKGNDLLGFFPEIAVDLRNLPDR